jgi:hypothetical protein
MRAVDTNVLVRLITRDDARRAAAADWRNKPRPLRCCSTIGTWCLQDPDTVSVALALFRAKRALDFSDCLMLQLAWKAGDLPLGTFDRNLSKVDSAQKL